MEPEHRSCGVTIRPFLGFKRNWSRSVANGRYMLCISLAKRWYAISYSGHIYSSVCKYALLPPLCGLLHDTLFASGTLSVLFTCRHRSYVALNPSQLSVTCLPMCAALLQIVLHQTKVFFVVLSYHGWFYYAPHGCILDLRDREVVHQAISL